MIIDQNCLYEIRYAVPVPTSLSYKEAGSNRYTEDPT